VDVGGYNWIKAASASSMLVFEPKHSVLDMLELTLEICSTHE
jgi:hypothetical protein